MIPFNLSSSCCGISLTLGDFVGGRTAMEGLMFLCLDVLSPFSYSFSPALQAIEPELRRLLWGPPCGLLSLSNLPW